MAKTRVPHVYVSFRIVNMPGSEVFSGAIQGLRTCVKWRTRLFVDPLRLTPNDIATARQNDVSGIIINHPLQEDLTDALLESEIPLVVLGNSDQRLFRRVRNVAFIETDHRKDGEMAADYFLSMGNFRSFAYLPDIPSSRWSSVRLRGYRARLRKSGKTPAVFAGGDVGTWLAALKKPIALFLAGDYLASDAMAACEACGLAVPSDISILGVDNNPILCESASTPLSSIQPDFARTGLMAVRTLEKMMRAKKDSVKPIVLRAPPLRVVERASTARTKPSANLVESALRFIRENVERGIRAGDVARHLGVSPQLMALRFSQLEKKSVRETIIEMRLERVRKLLETTNLTVAGIANRCGFNTSSLLIHQFVDRFGIPPREWRKQRPSPKS